MSTLINKHDTLETIIYTEGVKIMTVDIHADMDMLVIILNTGYVLQEKISKHPILKNANNRELLNYKLIGNGTGIHWPDLDEDISLKGILGNTLRDQILGSKVA